MVALATPPVNATHTDRINTARGFVGGGSD
jgi:hypothetical protein